MSLPRAVSKSANQRIGESAEPSPRTHRSFALSLIWFVVPCVASLRQICPMCKNFVGKRLTWMSQNQKPNAKTQSSKAAEFPKMV